MTRIERIAITLLIVIVYLINSCLTSKLDSLHERITILQGQVQTLQADTQDLYAVQTHQTGMMDQFLEMGRQ